LALLAFIFNPVLGLVGLTTTDFYSDAGHASTTCDASYMQSAGDTWDNIHHASSCDCYPDSAYNYYVRLLFNSSTNVRLYRSGFGFNTSSIPDDYNVDSASFYPYGVGFPTDDYTVAKTISLVGFSPATNNNFINTDYDGYGTTKLASDVNFKSMGSGYKELPLNASGLAYINKAGITNFMLMATNDLTDTSPAEDSKDALYYGNFADNGTNKPKLTVTYTSPVVAPTVTTQAVTDIAKTTATGNGTITDDGGEATATRGICWKTSSGPTVSDSHATNGTGEGAYTVSMTGLLPNTHYYVRAYSINSAGTSYGAEVEFTTLSDNAIFFGCNC
jgi:hypothetical protein